MELKMESKTVRNCACPTVGSATAAAKVRTAIPNRFFHRGREGSLWADSLSIEGTSFRSCSLDFVATFMAPLPPALHLTSPPAEVRSPRVRVDTAPQAVHRLRVMATDGACATTTCGSRVRVHRS